MQIIDHPILPHKGRSWHNISHQYFTKQASNVVAEYIEHYSKPGDVVLDCFCGTGVTAIEALRLGRKVIALDINPLACFITEMNCAQFDIDTLINTFLKIKKKVKKQIDAYYALSNEELDSIPIEYWYPKNVRLPKNSDFDYVDNLFSKRQLLSYSLLFDNINRIKDLSIRNQMKFIFSANMSKVNLTYMPSEKNGKQVGGGGAAIFGTYRYWKPSVFRELDVWSNFEYRFNKIISGKRHWNSITKGIEIKNNLQVTNCSVLEMDKYIDEDSIDYIYTDPPYGGNIAYLDLSTMWNAWLGFEVNSEMRNQEIIEGGDLEKTQKNYETLFSESFIQMSRVLKKDGWLSLVFAHKKLEFWNLIINSCEENGLEFKGSIFQPTNNSSIHYKKNPAKVLCSQRIAGFQKTYEKSKRQQPDDIKEFIINEIEKACIEKRGAPLDYIYQKVLDQLHDNYIIHEAKKKGYLNLNKILDDTPLFYYDADKSLYFIQDWEEKSSIFQKSFFKRKNELTVFLRSLLKDKKSLSFSEIYKEIFEIYADEKKFPVGGLKKDLYETLQEIAYVNGRKNEWVLKSEQMQLDYDAITPEKLVKIEASDLSHSEVIFRLVQLGKVLGFHSWIGKREQSVNTFQGYSFDMISLPEIPLKIEDEQKKNKIKQIDVIWFDHFAYSKYAFEIEESTNILSGFERFSHILDVEKNLSRKLFIVAPKSRERKILDCFHNSTYIGHPFYLENKVGLIYKEDFIKFYDEKLFTDIYEDDLKKLFFDFRSQ